MDVVKTDGSDQRYVEVDLPLKQKLRLTFIRSTWDDEVQPGIRLQIRDEEGRLRPGPEVPINHLGAVASALVTILVQTD